jgi:DNA polymerase/3'-5' exonuclease PolX
MLDLLNLIGQAIENLQRSIELFEVSERDAGLDQIASVIQQIDCYLERIDEDPLLKITTIDRAGLGERLLGVKGELALVIESVLPNVL